MSNNIKKAGRIDERGFINNLSKNGFTPIKSCGELLANSSDAYATTAIFDTNYDAKTIKLIDNGIGMTEEGLYNMCCMYKENHSKDQSKGISGFGGSAAGCNLSKNTKSSPPRQVTYFTKNINGTYLRADVPWNKIFVDGIFTDQILFREMTVNEITQFHLERSKHNLSIDKGTTIEFPYSEEFSNLLIEQFTTKKNSLENSFTDVFGKDGGMTIKYDKNDGLDPIILRKYDYFEGSDNTFYGGKFSSKIYYVTKKVTGEAGDKNNEIRFVCENPNNTDEYWEITRHGRGFNKNVKVIDKNSIEIIPDDHITFTSGMRIDNNIFDINNPTEIKANYEINNYDKNFMNDTEDNKHFCGKISLYRNNQKITGYVPQDHRVSNARGDGRSMIKILYTRNSLEYEVISKQNNTIDMIFGIQANKNENQNDFPANFTRLVQRLIDEKVGKLKKYFKDVISNKNNKIKEVVISNKNNKKKQKVDFEEQVEEQAEEQPEEQAEEQPAAEQKEAAEEQPEEQDVEDEEQGVVEQGVEEQEEEVEEQAVEDEEEEVIEEQVVEEIIQELVEEVVEENETVDIENSRQLLIQASQHIMEIAANPNYSKKNGKEIYEKIISLLNN